MERRGRLPLEDVTVVDLSWVIAGPHATELLVQLGANVIKVESHRSPDLVRTAARRNEADDPLEEGGFGFQLFNTGKKNISINLKLEKGREAFEDLVRKADFVVCNYGTNAFKKLRLTYEDLCGVKPDIIVVNASGMGFTGPYSQYVTYAPPLQAATGISSCVGYDGEADPYDDYPPLADYMGSLAIANHLLAALEYRRRTGKGQFIDLSQCETAVTYLGTAILDHEINGRVHRLFGNHHYANGAAPHNTYPCREPESWCAIAVASEEEWHRFCAVADPGGLWSNGQCFASLEQRIAHQKELDERVAAWTRQYTPIQAAEKLQAAGVSAAPVSRQLDFLYHDPQMQARKYFRQVDMPQTEHTTGTFLINGPVARFPEQPMPEHVEAGHALGQDTDEILSVLLGKPEQWIAEGKEEGAFY